MPLKVYDIGEDRLRSSWLGVVQPKQKTGLKNLNINTAEQWVVKLQFKDPPDTTYSYGSAFYINIPECKKEVILTAGHNLINDKGMLTTDLTILSGDPQVSPIQVPSDRIYIAKAYKQDQKNVEADWGVVILDPETRQKDAANSKLGKPKGKSGFGFGFSLSLAYLKKLEGNVYVHGYRSTTPEGKPDINSGECKLSEPGILKYTPETEQGLSGSAVWVENDGYPTVVAVHNRGLNKDKSKDGSRGSRLSLAVLREIFDLGLINAIEHQVRVRASFLTQPTRPLLQKGLYLIFPESLEFGRVRLSTGTIFDLIPANVNPERKSYALALDSGKKWVLFNKQRNRVELTETPGGLCFFEKNKPVANTKGFQVVFERDGEKLALKMLGNRIVGEEEEDAESSEVYFVKYPTKPPKDAGHIIFEP